MTPAVRLTGRSWADATLESDAKARVAKYNNEVIRFMIGKRCLVVARLPAISVMPADRLFLKVLCATLPSLLASFSKRNAADGSR